MKVLTIKQPWASLIMQGYKRFEFRSWKTNYRGPLLIHAGKGIDKEAVIRLKKYLPDKLPKGQILGRVNVVDCIECNEDFKNDCLKENSEVYAKSTFEEKFAWKLEDIEIFDTPIDINGKLGLWNYDISNYYSLKSNYLNLKDNDDYSKLIEPAKIIQNRGLVLFPTETVYGIGANGLDDAAVKKIFDAKKRASDNPLILHVSSKEMVEKLAKNITEIEYKLMERFWPGPFTIILQKQSNVPDSVTGGLDTVAVRMPSNIIARKLIEYSGLPIAAPSANVSGRPSGTCVEDVYDELYDKMDYIIDGGKCRVGLESTVVKVENDKVNILRPGAITKEQLEEVVKSVNVDKNVFGVLQEGEKVLSPGMKYKHYAPKSKCVLIYSYNNDSMVDRIKELSKEYSNAVVICSTENMCKYKGVKVLSYGSKENLNEISSNIFTLLRKVDEIKADMVFIEGVKKEGIGLAIMNRLIRACSHQYEEI